MGLLKTSLFRIGDVTLTSTYSDSYQFLLAMLVEARKHARLSQAQLAARLNKPQSFVSKFERGERRLDVIELLSVCQMLEADPHDLIQRLEERLRYVR